MTWNGRLFDKLADLSEILRYDFQRHYDDLIESPYLNEFLEMNTDNVDTYDLSDFELDDLILEVEKRGPSVFR